MSIAPPLMTKGLSGPGPTPTHGATHAASAHRHRITSIDTLRGLVIVIMLLDHVRETLYLHLQVTDPMTVSGTPRPVMGFLLKRGLLLIALELTLINFAWSGT